MLNVPAGSNTGNSLRLKGRGLLDRKSGQRGDQYVKLKVVLPDKPDDKLKAFLESWEEGKALRSARVDGAVHMTSLDELLRLHGGLTTVHVERWVARGLLRPRDSGESWSFEQVDVARARLLAELGDDIGFDDETVETVVCLVDQVHTLRGQLDLLARAIAEQPAETREAIAVALQKLDVR